MNLIDKVNKLIFLSENLLQGTVEDLPKNIVNFKMGIEIVKIELEQQKISDKKSLHKQFPGFFSGSKYEGDPTRDFIHETEENSQITEEKEDTPTPTLVDNVIEEPPVKKKRIRRTKAQILADKLAAEQSNNTPTQEGELTELKTTVEKLTEVEDKFDKVIEDAKNINTGDKEDWETELNTSEPKEEEKEEEVNATTAELEITNTINKYPDPFNLALLTTRKEKLALIEDMLYIKKLVGNENSADIKMKVNLLDLDEHIAERATKFLIFLPHLMAQVK